MSESRLIETEVSILRGLEELSTERARAEGETELAFQARRSAEAKAAQQALQKLSIALETETTTTKARYQEVRTGILKQHQTEYRAAAAEYAGVKQRIVARYNAAKKVAKKAHEDSRWQALAVFEAAKGELIKRYKAAESEVAAAGERLGVLKETAAPFLADCRKYAGPEPEATANAQPAVSPPASNDLDSLSTTPSDPTIPAGDDPLPELLETIKRAEAQLVPLAKLGLPRFLKFQNYIWLFLILGLAGIYPLGLLIGWIAASIVCGVLALSLAIGVRIWLVKVATRQVGRIYSAFRAVVAEADALQVRSLEWARATSSAARARSRRSASATSPRARRSSPGP